MARGDRRNGTSGYGYSNTWNEVNNVDPNSPDVTGTGIYFDGFPEVHKFHLLATGPLDETPNSRSGRGVFGGPAPGEPNPAGMGRD